MALLSLLLAPLHIPVDFEIELSPIPPMASPLEPLPASSVTLTPRTLPR
jgi:hypothetical protein